MMSAIITQSGDSRIITFGGELTLKHADEMRTTFMRAMLDADNVLIEFTTVTEVDLLYLELLCSVHRTAVKLNKHVAFTGSRPALLVEAMKAAGYSRATGCTLDGGQSCFWSGLCE